MHAPAAAGPVLELVDDVHRVARFVVFLIRKAFAFCPSCRHRPGSSPLRSDTNGPYKTEQFASNGDGDLALVLAGGGQSGIALVQPKLCLPGHLFDVFRHTLLSPAQSRPYRRPEPVTPGGFDNNPALVCVPRLRDAAPSPSSAMHRESCHALPGESHRSSLPPV